MADSVHLDIICSVDRQINGPDRKHVEVFKERSNPVSVLFIHAKASLSYTFISLACYNCDYSVTDCSSQDVCMNFSGK